MKPTRALLSIMLAGVLLVSPPVFFASSVEAGPRGGSGGSSGSRSSGFSKGSAWSSSTHGTWNRNGGGLFGGGQPPQSGYSKPSLDKQTQPSGYSKPALKDTPGSPGHATPSAAQGGSTSGYSKPSLGQPPTSSSTTGGGASTGSGYGKPSLGEKPAAGVSGPAGSQASGGYAKPGGSTPARESFAGGSKFDKESIAQERKQRSQESLREYKAEQEKFKNPDYKVDPSKYESNPLYQKGKVYGGFDYGNHYSTRDNYYRGAGYQPSPFAFRTSPGFGLFDTIFLFWMLDHMGNRNVAATAYHHANDPGFQQWRREVEQLSKDNSDLKGKLAEMDKQVKSMEGTPKDPGYLPKGVPADVALSASALAAKKPDKPPVRFATGQVGGWYNKYGALFKKAGKDLDIQVINTSGSMENLKMLMDGRADLALVQSDALALIEKKEPEKKLISEQAELYVEYVQLIANRDGGVTALKDLDPRKNFVYVGPKGSGTALTWEALCEQDERYKKIPVKYADYATGLVDVRTNPKALMMFVGGLDSELLKKAEQEAKRSGKLRLVTFQDRQLNDKLDKNGNRIYKVVEIPSKIYPSLQKGWIFSGDVETLAVQAVLVLRTEWAEKYGTAAMDALSATVLETKPDIQRQVNGTQAKTGARELPRREMHVLSTGTN